MARQVGCLGHVSRIFPHARAACSLRHLIPPYPTPALPQVCNRVTGLLSPDPDTHKLEGALIYGTGRSDSFDDVRSHDSNWVGVENNAGFVGGWLAKCACGYQRAGHSCRDAQRVWSCSVLGNVSTTSCIARAEGRICRLAAGTRSTRYQAAE